MKSHWKHVVSPELHQRLLTIRLNMTSTSYQKNFTNALIPELQIQLLHSLLDERFLHILALFCSTCQFYYFKIRRLYRCQSAQNIILVLIIYFNQHK